jgi:hypothetical protein
MLEVKPMDSMGFLGVLKYAGGAQAMRPYLHISWGILGLVNAKNLYFIKNFNIEF